MIKVKTNSSSTLSEFSHKHSAGDLMFNDLTVQKSSIIVRFSDFNTFIVCSGQCLGQVKVLLRYLKRKSFEMWQIICQYLAFNRFIESISNR